MSTATAQQSETATAEPERVMLVDDDAMVRTGLRTIFEQSGQARVVAEAGDGDEVVDLVLAHRPAVVFMDIQMKRMSGLDAIRALQTVPAAPKVVALTSFGFDSYVFEALEAGASGFLLKDATVADLVDAIATVRAGDAVLSPRSTAQLVNHFAGSTAHTERARAARACRNLTDREREIAVLVAESLSNADIADRLYCSEATVKSHLGKTMVKLAADDRIQVALTAQKAGLV